MINWCIISITIFIIIIITIFNKTFPNIDLSNFAKRVMDLKIEKSNKYVNKKYSGKSIVLTTGTFLGGLVTRGSEKIASGRLMDNGEYQENDSHISSVLKKENKPKGYMKAKTAKCFI